MSKIRRALGLMSGTSMDGIDIALIETDGGTHVRRLGAASVAYPDDFRGRLRQALADATVLDRRDARPGCLSDVERELTERHAEAVLRFIGDRMLQPSAIDVIGFHGQTVLHRPGTGLTVQLGDGAQLAKATGIGVVYDLRANDVAAGGEGAPLAPAYHRALAAKLPQRPAVFLNIGGVANVTWVGTDETLIAFDTGPGNAMIDDLVLRSTGASRDEDGKLAASGTVDDRVVHAYLMHPYFAKRVPKSLDRNTFAAELVEGLSAADAAATLTAFAVEAIVKAREHVPSEPALWIVCGGGRRNRTLMRMLAARVENAVVPAEAVGLDGDTLEAEAWAYLAVRTLDGLPISWPGTTGVAAPTQGGVLSRPPG
ncbi:MAG: anhydro-N-acetylmuramic acid kinase [Hyphomicrobiaceae bacterium]